MLAYPGGDCGADVAEDGEVFIELRGEGKEVSEGSYVPAHHSISEVTRSPWAIVGTKIFEERIPGIGERAKEEEGVTAGAGVQIVSELGGQLVGETASSGDFVIYVPTPMNDGLNTGAQFAHVNYLAVAGDGLVIRAPPCVRGSHLVEDQGGHELLGLIGHVVDRVTGQTKVSVVCGNGGPETVEVREGDLSGKKNGGQVSQAYPMSPFGKSAACLMALRAVVIMQRCLVLVSHWVK